jgi:hypothetical protein
MNHPIRRIDLDDETQWGSITPEDYISAAVHRMLNQMNAVQFVMDAVTDPDVVKAIEGAQSAMLEDMDIAELMTDAAGSSARLIQTLKQLHSYAEYRREQATLPSPPPAAP